MRFFYAAQHDVDYPRSRWIQSPLLRRFHLQKTISDSPTPPNAPTVEGVGEEFGFGRGHKEAGMNPTGPQKAPQT